MYKKLVIPGGTGMTTVAPYLEVPIAKARRLVARHADKCDNLFRRVELVMVVPRCCDKLLSLKMVSPHIGTECCQHCPSDYRERDFTRVKGDK